MHEQHPTLERVGAVVREHRIVLGISQRELAARAKLHYNYISGIERGERNPTVLVLERVVEALEITLAQLFTDASL